MENVLIIDTSQVFLSDFESQLIIHSSGSNYFTESQPSKVKRNIQENNITKLIVSCHSLATITNMNLGIPTFSYARVSKNTNEIDAMKKCMQYDYACYGVVRKSKDLFQALESDNTINAQDAYTAMTGEVLTDPSQRDEKTGSEVPLTESSNSATSDIQTVLNQQAVQDQSPIKQQGNVQQPTQQLTQDGQPYAQQGQPIQQQTPIQGMPASSDGKVPTITPREAILSNMQQSSVKPENEQEKTAQRTIMQASIPGFGSTTEAPVEQVSNDEHTANPGLASTTGPAEEQSVQSNHQVSADASQENTLQSLLTLLSTMSPTDPSYVGILQTVQQLQTAKNVKAIQDTSPSSDITPTPDFNSQQNSARQPIQERIEVPNSGSIKDRLDAIHKKEQEDRIRAEAAARKMSEEEINHAVEKDLGNVQMPAKLVTIYSAKGGVGKTSIACELATFLALTAHSRDKFKVCIADFNIDFGDVLGTLDYDISGCNMMHWAADIQRRMGEGDQNIQYTREQIYPFLQRKDDTGLYALIAPLSSEEGMSLSQEEFKIMLDNLVNNAGFDFIICDTGNNLSDFNVLAFEMAKVIFLVMTQDMNTANCNNNFISLMDKFGLDMDKIKLIVNRIKPYKQTGIRTEDIEFVLKNPRTEQPFDCVCRIKEVQEVQSAANLGKPLALSSPNSDFVKSIGTLASSLISDNFVLEEPKKKRFGFFKKAKKD